MRKWREIYIQMDRFLDGAARYWPLLAFWLCISPVMLFIPKGITAIKNQQSLNNPRLAVITHCKVVVTWRIRAGEAGDCAFSVDGWSYTASGTIGFGNDSNSMPTILPVKYLRTNPSINEFGSVFGDYHVNAFELILGCFGAVIWFFIGYGIIKLIIQENQMRMRMTDRLTRAQGASS